MTKRMDIREMHTVFQEFYTVQAKRYADGKPDAVGCLAMLEAAIITQQGYAEALTELIEMRRRRIRILTLQQQMGNDD